MDNAEIKDIVTYKGSDCILTKNGFISHSDNVYLSPIKLDRLEAINDNLIGISSGKCYVASVSGLKLSWKRLNEFPSNVVHTCVTRSEGHIWVQTDDTGYLFDSSLQLVEKCEVNGYRRNYGIDTANYINSSLDRNEIEIHSNQSKMSKSSKYTVYNLNGKCTIPAKVDSNYRDIRVTNSGVYYIL